jgi:hypothetical protein
MPSGEPRQVYNGSSTEYKSLFDDDGKSSVAPALFFDMSFNSARVRLSLAIPSTKIPSHVHWSLHILDKIVLLKVLITEMNKLILKGVSIVKVVSVAIRTIQPLPPWR